MIKLRTEFVLSAALIFLVGHAYAGHPVVHLGGYVTSQGQAENINIQGLIGDRYTLTKRYNTNWLFGFGYYMDMPMSAMKVMAGIDAYWLERNTIRGTIIQEQLFQNLAYHYDISNLPIYLAGKALFDQGSGFGFTVDAGIGANFVITQHYQDWSLDGGVTLPDNAFNNHARAVFSATLGVGVAMTNVLNASAVECGYRLFYLGKGRLAKTSDQIRNSLSTGTNYANALVCSVVI